MRLPERLGAALDRVPPAGHERLRRIREIPAFFGAFVFAALVLAHADYVPMWDGRIYADCVVNAATRHLAPSTLRCAEHTTQAYVALMAIPQMLSPGNFLLLCLVNVALGLLAIGSFHWLLRAVFPGAEHAWPIGLVTVAFSIHPIFVASALQPNVDYGVVVFFLPCLLAFVARRPVLATVFGLLMAFSKETGALVYGVTLGCFVLTDFVRTPGSFATRLRAVRSAIAFVAPVVIVALYLAFRRFFVRSESVLWGNVDSTSLFEQATTLRLNDPVLFTYASGILVIDFLWLPTLFVVGDLLRRLVRLAMRAPKVAVEGSDPWTLRFVLLTAVMLGVALTRFRTFVNLRYFLPLYPLILIAFYAVVARMPIAARVRAAVVGLVGVLLLVSNFRTVDPVSRALYGTFAFGEHELLQTTSITHECCGFGRDQLVYDLEFTELDALQSDIFAELRPDADTVLAIDRYADWFLVGPLDAQTYRRTLRPTGSIEPRVLDAAGLLRLTVPPRRVYFIAHPNVDNRVSIAMLARVYGVTGQKAFERDGYRLVVYALARK